jgi:hypothetical protein
MSERVSKELSASAESLSESRECIDNQCLIVIIYFIASPQGTASSASIPAARTFEASPSSRT